MNYCLSYVISPFKSFCQCRILNGCRAKLAANMDAKVGLFILSDTRQHKKCFFNFHSFDFTAPLTYESLKVAHQSVHDFPFPNLSFYCKPPPPN